jgi:hypothetical protein
MPAGAGLLAPDAALHGKGPNGDVSVCTALRTSPRSAGAALGGSAEAYVSGLHSALIVGGTVAIAGAMATAALLVRVRIRAHEAEPVPDAA